jgi:hypothetical protein
MRGERPSYKVIGSSTNWLQMKELNAGPLGANNGVEPST